MRVLQLNLNHCEAAHDLLMQTVRELKVDLALISEPYRHLDTQPWEKDTTTKAVIWTCGKLPFQSLANCGEAHFVAAKLGGIHFYSCYAPPSLTHNEFVSFLDRLTEDARQHLPVAIAGDFNSWAVDWGSRHTDAKGRALLEAVSTLDVVLLNSGKNPTFMKGTASSIVDLTFVSSSIVRRGYSWEVADVYTASDHCALIWEVSTDQEARGIGRRTNAIGWKAKTFDPDTFLVALDTGPISGRDATEKASAIMRRVTEACDASMPRKSTLSRRPSVHWWSEHIATLRKECLKARRLSQRGRKRPNSEELEAQYKSARRELNKAIKDSKNRSWKGLVDEVDGDTWGRPYKVVMTRLRTQPMPSPTCPQLLKKIVQVLFPQQRELEWPTERCDVENIPPVTENELMEACARIGNTKAPGPDGIPNVALKAAIKAAPELFLDVYNTCLREGHFPAKWKQQRLVLLPKGKKPPDEPSSYRPLCMLDTGGKILERIAHRRIEAVVDPLLADRQNGFRKNHSTLDAIDDVVNTAKEAIAGKRWKGGTKKYCLVATLDIKNAFNSARWDCIMSALEAFQVPAYLRRLVGSYFTDRILRYDTQIGPKEYRVTGGVPQGSVLGPLLWNIMYDGLLKLPLPDHVKLVAFADDVAVVIEAKHLKEIQPIFDEIFVRIRRWMDSVGLTLAEHKTEAVLISSRKKVETIRLKVGDCELTSQPFIRYLGVMIDTRLNFKQHVEYVSAKASGVRTLLSRLMPNIGGPKQKRRALLSTVTTSVLTYGIPIWADALQMQVCRRKIAPVYRQSALRVASAYRTVSEDAVCVIAGMLPMEVLAEERKCLYRRRRRTSLSAKELREEERENSISRWQVLWDASMKGRWTYRLIPELEVWLNRPHGSVNYYLTQMLSGHGCFREYLHKFKHEDSPECPTCRGVKEDAEHVFFRCKRFSAHRSTWETAAQRRVSPENLVAVMISSEAAWDATSAFAAEVLKELRCEEQKRKEQGR